MDVKIIKGKFTEIENLAEKTRLFTIELDDEISFESGQFVNLIFEHEGKVFKKPYSIASSKENKDILQLIINLVEEGEATPSLFLKKVGDSCKIQGPLGLFKLNAEQPMEKVVLIGTGTGIAPLRSILFELLKERAEREIILVYGSRFGNSILFEREIDELVYSYPHFRFIKVISRPDDNWSGRTGYVQDNLDIVDFLNSEIYICGRPQMVGSVREKALLNGASEEFIYSEKYV